MHSKQLTQFIRSSHTKIKCLRHWPLVDPHIPLPHSIPTKTKIRKTNQNSLKKQLLYHYALPSLKYSYSHWIPSTEAQSRPHWKIIHENSQKGRLHGLLQREGSHCFIIRHSKEFFIFTFTSSSEKRWTTAMLPA